MLITIPDVLTAAEVAQARSVLDSANWVDGKVTAGHQSAKAKDNAQIPENHPAVREVGDKVVQRRHHVCSGSQKHGRTG